MPALRVVDIERGRDFLQCLKFGVTARRYQAEQPARRIGDVLALREQQLQAVLVEFIGESAASVRAALRAEKERQADLEAAGWRFARWMPGVPGATIAARVSRVLHLASGAPSRTLDLGA